MGVSPSKKSRISQASQRAQPDAASGIPDVAASPGMQLLDLFLGAAWGSQPGKTRCRPRKVGEIRNYQH